ncbi:MAG: glycosyltransferase 87 family protein, partial [Solirubrobacteraceae bacterium]
MTVLAAEPGSPTSAEPTRHPRDESWILAGVGLLALGTYLWQLSVPEQLSFYDSGVYLAAAVHLASGVVPYRDFTFVQPPGLLYLLSPVALASRLIGTHDGFTVGRVLDSVVTAANCVLTAALVRRHGRVAMIAAGVGVAMSPVAFLVSSAIKLDPFSLFFVLLAALVVVGRGEVAALSRRGSIVAGVALGVAGLVKLWAFFPFVAIVVLVAWRARGRVVATVASAGATFLVGVAPFLLASPRNFVAEVFVEQLGRRANAADSGSLFWRLRALTGYINTLVAPSTAAALIAFGTLAVLVVIAYRRWSAVSDADALILFCAVAVIVMLMSSPETYSYYDYYAQPFLIALAVGALWSLGAEAAHRVRAPRVGRGTRRVVVASAVASLALFSGALALYATSFYSSYAYVYGYYGPWMNPIARIVPIGDCVVYTEVAFGLFENRFISQGSTCPAVVDVY